MNINKKNIHTTLVDYLKENNCDDERYKKLMDIYDVPVDFLWNYREFDRCGVDNLYGNDYIDKLSNDIQENGIKQPIILQIDSGKGLIIEGNHRLCIAIKLGIETIPTKIIYRMFGSINKHKAKPIKYNSNKWDAGIWD